MWMLLVVSSAFATVDFYPAGNSQAECERLAQAARAARQSEPDITIACAESSKAGSWFEQHFPQYYRGHKDVPN